MKGKNIKLNQMLLIEVVMIMLILVNLKIIKLLNGDIKYKISLYANIICFAILLIYIKSLKSRYLHLVKMDEVKDILLNINHMIFHFDDINDLLEFIVKKALDIVGGDTKGEFIVATEDKGLESKYFKNKGNALSYSIRADGKLYGILHIYRFKKRGFRHKEILMMEYYTKQIGYIIEKYIEFNKIFDLYRYDGLTATFNRDYFEKMLDTFMRKKVPFSLVLFDLDELKEINDNYGHTTGDVIIKQFAKTIKNNMRYTDLIARYGGDEFIGIFFNSNEKNLHKRIADIAKKFELNPVIINGNKVIINFSYGIANFPNDTTDLSTLIEIADKKMYTFKNSKKNCSLNL